MKSRKNDGFTIVELLVVIVVIAILAAITIVVYTGVVQKATVAALQSDLINASQKLKIYQVTNMAYPDTIDCSSNPATNSICLKASSNNTFAYSSDNTTKPPTFSLTETATNGDAYTITEDTSPTTAVVKINKTFSYTGTIQTYTIPAGIKSIDITATGAQGGQVNSGTGGLGASVKGTFAVTPGQVLSILVGQQPPVNASYPAGGGGTFVALGADYTTATPMIVAGGGGAGNNTTGQGGQITNITTTGDGGGPAPGTSGNGAPSSACAGGGGGFYSSGGNDTYYSTSGVGGFGFRQGGAGGVSDKYQAGGFGGGATADYVGTCNTVAGSGGGYSGGSGQTTTSNVYLGYGGGSYNSGTNQVNTAAANSGNGQVVISN
jgi:prepilin-type N-terminal cleavage/methylation domain-containing protein